MSAQPFLESLETIPFPTSPSAAAEYHPPAWLSGAATDQCTDPILFFHDEVLAFARWVSPNKAEVAWRNQIVERLSRCVKSIWPSANIQVYGSTESGLCVPQSDIDVVIQNAEAGEGELKFHILADKLEAEGITFGRPFLVGGTRVPVMKMIDAESGCLVDVSFDGHFGTANTRLVMGFLDTFPLARPLALVVKYYLKQRKLNDTYVGGVGSYTLALLVISFMQRYSGKSQSLPVLLCAFFELYGLKFDYMNSVISVLRGGCYLTKEEKGWLNPECEDALAVEDPLIPDSDVGAASFNIREVKAAFADAFDILTRGPVHLNPNGGVYNHSLKMSLLRRLINVPATEAIQRKKIRDAYYGSLPKVSYTHKPPRSSPPQPATPSSSGHPSISTIQGQVTESKPRRRKPKKASLKPRDGGSGDYAALAGANSASAAHIGAAEGHPLADVSDAASHSTFGSRSVSSDDDNDISNPSSDSEKESGTFDWPIYQIVAERGSPHPSTDSVRVHFSTAAIPKDEINFPALGIAPTKFSVAQSPRHA